MTVCAGTWGYMEVYGGIWRYMKVYEGIWRYMEVYEDIWGYMSVGQRALFQIGLALGLFKSFRRVICVSIL